MNVAHHVDVALLNGARDCFCRFGLHLSRKCVPFELHIGVKLNGFSFESASAFDWISD